MARRSSPLNYGYLRRLIEQSLEACPGFEARIEGKIEPIAGGLWHENYRTISFGRCIDVRRVGLPDRSSLGPEARRPPGVCSSRWI